jgi:hypothetical protein
MANEQPLLPPPDAARQKVVNVTRETATGASAEVLSTRDEEVIREWARRVQAEPATGEATGSGPASSLKVVDGGTGLRFNFPSVSRFREISWAEWFEHFNSHDLTFVYDNPELGPPPSARYRIVPTGELARV